MELIKWRDEFSTGISSVDYEHQKLIEDINSVYELIDDRADPESVVEHLGDIYGSISAHFALEEKMMRQYKYDNYEEHMMDHNRLLDGIVDITEEYESSSTIDEKVFKQKLNDWFQTHFKTHDSRLHKLAEFMTHPKADEKTMAHLLKKARQRFFSKADKRPEV